jgi:hypothetical protein
VPLAEPPVPLLDNPNSLLPKNDICDGFFLFFLNDCFDSIEFYRSLRIHIPRFECIFIAFFADFKRYSRYLFWVNYKNIFTKKFLKALVSFQYWIFIEILIHKVRVERNNKIIFSFFVSSSIRLNYVRVLM